MSYSISRQMDFCYGHRLPDHAGKCRFLHGHNGRVEITIQADSLDDGGMVMDFGEFRSGIEAWIDEELDHHTILFREDPLLPLLRNAGQKIVEIDSIPTAENIAALIFGKAQSMGLNVIRVRVWETARNMAEFNG
ncbi:MAG: 6-carboxytetrahydropterin synthase [Planctomycetaceae bacterium]|nr:6-carboxytetrahydropterin synthase [Planctomycetaceae bacterium]MBQ2821494.1 6-carboxytetrahydropterin synthase [Thermoguttaceae bacterium]MDO4425030.1 6-carboxytetrahydropterin synthase [Planctomycetia bacterium]